MTVLLELDGVSKSYGALKAVDAVSLAVEGGEALAVIGPNGAGKTTLFNLITGDVAPSKGRIVFGGADMTAMAPHARSRLGIGRSYQIPHPFANMSVFENLLVGAIYGGGASERDSYPRCCDVLRVTGLYDKANVPARTLTLLQRKRLELARALAIQPKLLAARRDRRRSDRIRMRRTGQDHQDHPRQWHDDRLDRAYRPRAGVGGQPADRHELRPDPGRRAIRARSWPMPSVREVYMGMPVS